MTSYKGKRARFHKDGIIKFADAGRKPPPAVGAMEKMGRLAREAAEFILNAFGKCNAFLLLKILKIKRPSQYNFSALKKKPYSSMNYSFTTVLDKVNGIIRFQLVKIRESKVAIFGI